MLNNHQLVEQCFVCEKHGKYKLTIPQGAKGICNICDKQKKEDEAYFLSKKLLHSMGVTPRFFPATIDNFLVKTEQQKNALNEIKYWFNNFKRGSSKNLCMVGTTGTGKTHLSVSIMKRAYKDINLYSRYISTPSVSQQIKDSYNNVDLHKSDIIEPLKATKLLIIDEIGRQTTSDHEWIFELINTRYLNKLPTVIISNLNKSGIKDQLGSACCDRIFGHGASVVPFTWDSYR